MPLFPVALDAGGEAIADVLLFAQFHSDAPGAAGTANVIAGGRVALDMVSTDGNLSLATPAVKTGLTPSTDLTHISIWNLAAAGVCQGTAARVGGDPKTNALGEYTINSLTIPVVST